MARTVREIKAQMTVEWISNPSVISAYELQDGKTFEEQFSVVSVESILFYVFAIACWTMEILFDRHKAEVTDIIDRTKPHTAAWYVEKCKAYQWGFDLLDGSDKFDNTGYTQDEIDSSFIVKYAAALEQNNGLRLKVAKISNGDLSELSAAELNNFDYYISRIKDAGVRMEILTGPADRLKLDLTVYYNPLVINSAGHRVDGTAQDVVKTAIKGYLAAIEFDAMLVTAYLVDALQKIDGVRFPHINAISCRYANLDWIPVAAFYLPNSGYIRIDDADLTISYQPI